MKIKYYLIILIFVFIYPLLSAFTIQNKADSSNSNIIKFSHKYHIAEQEAECTDCHAETESSEELSNALLPTMETCGNCHDVEDKDECLTCHYENVQEPFPNKQFEVFFSHASHLNNGKVNCANCHKDLDKVNYASELSSTEPSMSDCNVCHSDSGPAKATTFACESCHISTATLFPDNHKIVDFQTMHKFSSNEADADCQMCHDNNFCETCHIATTNITESNSAEDFYTPFSPHRYIDNTKQQQITRVHDLNYQYNHGIDARGKSSNCQTCHQTETFCAECHNVTNKGDFALEGMLPGSHTKNDFMILGVGSGGGVHADLARRDIESCAACHDVEGADPACVLCHLDNDGIKGTNPKTHAVGYLHNEEGNWHGDFGAVCYNCHTDAGALSQTPGQGFCGYCHGSEVD